MIARTRAGWKWLWTWGPVLGLMALIFAASSLPKLPSDTPGAAFYFSGWMPVFPPPWEAIIKKSGHFLVYALLAASLWRALRSHHLPVRRAVVLTAVIALAYAISDEWHQSFVDGRRASALDVAIDGMGIALALLVALARTRCRAHLVRSAEPPSLAREIR